jgi:hypothetical protein
MITLGFVETIQTIQARNELADQILAQSKEMKAAKGLITLEMSPDTARLLADDLVIVAAEAAQQTADEMQPELRQRVVKTGTSSVAPLLVASTSLGLAGLAAIIGLWKPQ